MENSQKNNNNTNNSGVVNSKKYKFYKKPPVRKTVPEVKQTKTSIARILKANPLLKYENNQVKDIPTDASTNSSKILPINTKELKMSLMHFSGNGPKIGFLCNAKISCSDPDNPILSSTLITDEEVFAKPTSKPQFNLPKKKEPLKNNVRPVSTKPNIVRKTLSSQHIEKRKKELYEITKRGKISNGINKPLKSILKRRSRSLDNFDTKGCYRIKEEEDRSQLNEADSHSMHNLSQLNKEPQTALYNGFNNHSSKFPSSEEMRRNGKSVSPPPKQEYDEENKENIEVGILECDSYNDLHILNDDINFRKSKELGRYIDKNCNNSKYDVQGRTS
ncbi:uncharacterized protein [Diabrotica undecimpunctata]|uniref:uncharacterized protein n=1 Tax=Diabrotica undecimpunctata TaxID=50387 RepID=UPI003B6360D3